MPLCAPEGTLAHLAGSPGFSFWESFPGPLSSMPLLKLTLVNGFPGNIRVFRVPIHHGFLAEGLLSLWQVTVIALLVFSSFSTQFYKRLSS